MSDNNISSLIENIFGSTSITSAVNFVRMYHVYTSELSKNPMWPEYARPTIFSCKKHAQTAAVMQVLFFFFLICLY